MLIWMISIVGMATLLCATSWLAEKAARVQKAPTRWIWTLAIIGSLLLPAALRFILAEWSSLAALIPAQSAAPPGAKAQFDLLPGSHSLGVAPITDSWQRYD